MIKILSTDQIRAWDQFTIDHEPISSVQLMERAASQCTDWILSHYPSFKRVHIFCGIGNNGGDGLVIARQLSEASYKVNVYILAFSKNHSHDFIHQLNLLDRSKTSVIWVEKEDSFQFSFEQNDLVVDAIFGSGLSRPMPNWVIHITKQIQKSELELISIDLPSGMMSMFNHNIPIESIVNATHTLTFQVPKLAMFLPEVGQCAGNIHCLDIHLHPTYYQDVPTLYHLSEAEDVIKKLQKRNPFSHKGTFGHAYLIGGSFGKMGSIALASEACLRSGVGLVTTTTPACGNFIIQSVVPEAMYEANFGEHFIKGDATIHHGTIGIGPGLGTHQETENYFKSLLKANNQPMVVDADALNILSNHKDWLTLLPKGSILTPHPGEFKRLVGGYDHEEDKLQKLLDLANLVQGCVILKGRYTCIADTHGRLIFNTTGNPGMATGGSGDVLTGILTGLLCQGYSATDASLIGVYVHGKAGDLAAKAIGQHSIIARDIIQHLGPAFLTLEKSE